LADILVVAEAVPDATRAARAEIQSIVGTDES
jgi:hypothetical protein